MSGRQLSNTVNSFDSATLSGVKQIDSNPWIPEFASAEKFLDVDASASTSIHSWVSPFRRDLEEHKKRLSKVL